VAGPLAGYGAAFGAHLSRSGYTPLSAGDLMRAMARVSRWLEERGLAAGRLTPLLAADLQAGVPHAGPVLRFLREAGVVPAASVAGAGLGEPLDAALAQLDAGQVTSFMVSYCQGRNPESAKATVTAVRALLRFLHVTGQVPVPLAGAVPAVAGWRLASLPRGLDAAVISRLLASCDRGTITGRRDFAILTVLARLGLRGAEVAALGLADVDWRGGQVAIRGKGSRIERLPLPADVGEAMAAYLIAGRPRCAARAVFCTVRAPYQQLTPAAIRAIMGRACRRAGLPRAGAHRLRHSLATEMLRAGASLPEVGQVLRHRSQLATSVYAKGG
jgi:integrase